MAAADELVWWRRTRPRLITSHPGPVREVLGERARRLVTGRPEPTKVVWLRPLDNGVLLPRYARDRG